MLCLLLLLMVIYRLLGGQRGKMVCVAVCQCDKYCFQKSCASSQLAPAAEPQTLAFLCNAHKAVSRLKVA